MNIIYSNKVNDNKNISHNKVNDNKILHMKVYQLQSLCLKILVIYSKLNCNGILVMSINLRIIKVLVINKSNKIKYYMKYISHRSCVSQFQSYIIHNRVMECQSRQLKYFKMKQISYSCTSHVNDNKIFSIII